MSIKASQFQQAMSIIKSWWLDGFEKRKVNGQFALLDGEPSTDWMVRDYISGYSSKAQRQPCGTANVHIRFWSYECVRFVRQTGEVFQRRGRAAQLRASSSRLVVDLQTSGSVRSAPEVFALCCVSAPSIGSNGDALPA